MTKKISAGLTLSLLIALLLSPQQAFCVEQTPEQLIQEFYTWYITTNKGMMRAIKDDGIYRYVAAETVKRVKSPEGRDNRDQRDYFTQLFDPPLDMSGVSILVGQVTRLDKNAFVAPVTIAKEGSGDLVVIVVVLKKLDDGLKITKCMDIYPAS